MRIQIVGSGSAGMHFLRGAEIMCATEIVVVDNSQEMLDSLGDRFFARYGHRPVVEYSKIISGADITVIATPPDTHLYLAEQADDRSTHVIIEKPLCAPGQFGRLMDMRWHSKVWVNYQYILHPSIQWLKMNLPRIQSPVVGHVRWMEHSDFCAKAHPWAKDSWYLFDSSRGGGAANEHSHGIAMWVLALASSTSGGLQSLGHKIIKDGYDTFSQFSLALSTPDGHVPILGSVTTDFLCREPIKEMILTCEEATGYINFVTQDAEVITESGSVSEQFAVSREEEFTLLLKHVMTEDYTQSPLALHNVLPVQEILSSHYKTGEEDESHRVH